MASGIEKKVFINIDSLELEGLLAIPKNPLGLVIFAHGSGSSRLSPRNQFVAQILQQAGLATLLFDLLTENEDKKYDNRFDIPLLANRLTSATKWVKKQPGLENSKIGYFGASTGAAAALIAAANSPNDISAVVSRGGRPDLADNSLPQVQAPTLLIIGSLDHDVIKLNQEAADQMTIKPKIEIIPGATHLFEEPETLEQAAELALDWLQRHLS